MNRSRAFLLGALALTMLFLTAAAGVEAAARKKTAARKPAGKAAAPTAAKPKLPADPRDALLRGATRLEVAPSATVLDGPRAVQHLVVTATLQDGTICDVTDRVTFTVGNPRVARVAAGVVHPVANGETQISARLNQLSGPTMTVTVRNAQAPVTPEFINDVMPILSKAGCNASNCHGSPVGKAGFKLSLFGYEPDLDHPAIVTGSEGRRVNRDDPARSLLLLKPTLGVPHGGGKRFDTNSSEYRTLLAWLKAGAPGIRESAPRVARVEVVPERPFIPVPGLRQRLVVMAHMSDGTARDVTEKALFSSNDDAIADVNGDGVVVARRPGETAIMIRHLGQVAVSRVAVLPPWKLEPYPRLAQNNFIDEKVQAKLRQLRVVPSELCSDEEFIRRVTLDTCGILPTVEEVRDFLADTTPDKRAKLIDRLLERPEFADLWTLKWNDTLRNNPRLTRQGLVDYHNWIREQLAKNRPYDEFVRDLLTARGKTADIQLDPNNLPRQLQMARNAEQLVKEVNEAPFNPATNYWVISRDPLDVTSATSQIFLGVRIECARCHNHPFEKWTQNDYYALAGFFAGVVVRGNNQTPRVVSVNDRAPGIRHPKTREFVELRTLDGPVVNLPRGADRRAALAAWMTSPENPFFARNAVNRIWAHYMGRGIVEPVDDFRVTNPPSNPELLDALAQAFIDSKFDLKQIHRLILNSRTYQQSSRPNRYNAQDTSNFARYYPKRMMAEQLYDSISQATGVFLPTGAPRRNAALRGPYGVDLEAAGPITRVAQLPTLPNARQGPAGGLRSFLDTFGKPRREVVCECERSTDGNIGQALALINGDEVNAKIAARQGRVQRLIRQGGPDAAVIEELYLATLSRRPTPVEQQEAQTLIRMAASRAEGIEDLMWSLLNSREFLFIH